MIPADGQGFNGAASRLRAPVLRKSDPSRECGESSTGPHFHRVEGRRVENREDLAEGPRRKAPQERPDRGPSDSEAEGGANDGCECLPKTPGIPLAPQRSIGQRRSPLSGLYPVRGGEATAAAWAEGPARECAGTPLIRAGPPG